MKKIGIVTILMVVATLVTLSAVAGDEDVALGKAVFLKRCKMCHGADGAGNPAMARMLKVTFKPMESDYVQQKSDAEFKEIITKGKGKMAVVRGITDEEIAKVISYLRSLKPVH